MREKPISKVKFLYAKNPKSIIIRQQKNTRSLALFLYFSLKIDKYLSYPVFSIYFSLVASLIPFSNTNMHSILSYNSLLLLFLIAFIFCTGDLTNEEALKLAAKTWGMVKPVVHYSQSRAEEQNNTKIKANAHSDNYWTAVNTYGQDVDVMLECKHKEIGLFSMRELLND